MAKRLKYFNEVQIMRNNMELVKDTNGSVSVTPEEVTVQDRGTFVITYTVGDDPQTEPDSKSGLCSVYRLHSMHDLHFRGLQ